MPPHPASAFDKLRLGHPLPAGERRFPASIAASTVCSGAWANALKTSSPRGERVAEPELVDGGGRVRGICDWPPYVRRNAP